MAKAEQGVTQSTSWSCCGVAERHRHRGMAGLERLTVSRALLVAGAIQPGPPGREAGSRAFCQLWSGGGCAPGH